MPLSIDNRPHNRILNPTLLIVSLGNFIDAFDLFFNALRSSSLHELGLSGDALTKAGIQILNFQVIGMFLGGFLWGTLGDKIGRKKALIGSVLLYSLGSIGCAFVNSVSLYTVMRFITGLGLSGELGLGAILVTETLPDTKRNWALGIFACFSGSAIFAASALPEFLSWRMCYAVRGIAGLLVLLVRVIMFESGLFNALLQNKIKRGSLLSLLKNPNLLKRWICCVMLYMPQVFVTGFLMTLVPEIGQAVDVLSPVKANIALMVYFAGQFTADILGVIACNIFQRRKPVILSFLALSSLLVIRYLTLDHPSALSFYICCGCMGLCATFILNVFLTIEQFGNNMRATAGTSALSSTRTTLVLTNLLYLALCTFGLGTIEAMAVVSACVYALGFLGFFGLKETYHQSMDFIENL